MPNCNVVGKIVFSRELDESELVDLSYFLTQIAIKNRIGLNLDVNLTSEGQYFYPIKNYHKEGFIPYEIVDSPLTNECFHIFDNISYGPDRDISIERTGLSKLQNFYEEVLEHCSSVYYLTVCFYDKHSSDPEWRNKTDKYVRIIKPGDLCKEIERTPLGKYQCDFPDVRLKIIPSKLREAHDFCWNNRRDLEQSSVCGCFYCMNIYSPKEINQWIDDGETALCAHCGIDSVISEKSGYPLTKDFLSEMNRFWFSCE